MEKLKLEHLAPYLPFELEYLVNDNDILSSAKKIYRIEYLDIRSIEFCLNHKIKPILRPISDLTDDILKEIFNDEQLVVDRLKYAIIVKYQSMGEWFNEIIPIREVTDDRNGHLIYTAWLFIELCKRHFDVFGLIHQGLAIDKNTLK